MGMLTRVTIPIAVVLLGLVGASSTAHATGEGNALFGPAYKSVKVVNDGDPHPLFEDTTIRLKFRHEDERDVAVWRADCNLFAAPVEVRPKRLELGLISGTEVGCAQRLHRQDRWLAGFFGSDPKWARHGRTLRLDSGADRIVLKRRA
jgi:heat shock protein HslJ